MQNSDDIPLQSHFLYQNGWSEDIDECFITTLLEQKDVGNWIPSLKGNYHALLMAQGDVNKSAWWTRTWEDIVAHQAQLKKCYHAFKRIIESAGVTWDTSLNIVKAYPFIWEKLIKRDQFAATYFHRGEPQFINLNRLFGKDGRATIYFGHEVVNLSDSATDNLVVLSDDSDEAISPLTTRFKTHICKNLFSTDPIDEMPKPLERSIPRLPLANAFPKKPQCTKGGHLLSRVVKARVLHRALLSGSRSTMVIGKRPWDGA